MPNEGQIESLPVSAAVTAYHCVYPSGDGTIAHAADGTVPVIGISTGAQATTGGACSFAVSGMPLAEYGGTITAGNRLMATTGGKVIALTQSSATDDNKFVVGTALYSGVSGDIKRILFNPHQGADVSVVD